MRKHDAVSSMSRLDQRQLYCGRRNQIQRLRPVFDHAALQPVLLCYCLAYAAGSCFIYDASVMSGLWMKVEAM
jgi:hypothetical protein